MEPKNKVKRKKTRAKDMLPNINSTQAPKSPFGSDAMVPSENGIGRVGDHGSA